ncbi:unnamed protein product [Merluccius merluccius]
MSGRRWVVQDYLDLGLDRAHLPATHDFPQIDNRSLAELTFSQVTEDLRILHSPFNNFRRRNVTLVSQRRRDHQRSSDFSTTSCRQRHYLPTVVATDLNAARRF